MGRLLLLFVVVACFVIGYRIVSGLFKNKAFTDSKRRDSNNSYSARRKAEPQAKEMERYYRNVLGVSEEAGEQEIKAAHRSQLAKYHPDKVTHLGDEFYELASSRTREILQAYDYLKNKYGFK
ncbi:MAG: DnaJ domain-containing protein [Acidobacteria bacterium]|nr:DnaJ domain-containing protein [Acidobacteriota bacterium]